MTSKGLGEMFEGDSADTCAEKFLLVLMGGRAEGLACADPGAKNPIGASGNLQCIFKPLIYSDITSDKHALMEGEKSLQLDWDTWCGQIYRYSLNINCFEPITGI